MASKKGSGWEQSSIKTPNRSGKMSYQLYRNTTLGNSLQESLDELIQVNYQLFLLSVCEKRGFGEIHEDVFFLPYRVMSLSSKPRLVEFICSLRSRLYGLLVHSRCSLSTIVKGQISHVVMTVSNGIVVGDECFVVLMAVRIR